MTTIEMKKLLRYAFDKGASDLHLTVGTPPVFRIDGDLKRLNIPPLTPDDARALAREIMDDQMFERFTEKGEVDFSYSLAGVSRFRVNAYHQRGCIGIVARVIPHRIPSLEELSMPESVKRFCHKPQGLVLVTGPTGSGKSTTLAAMIDYINRTMRKHIITLEDPIEYLHKHQLSIVNQREIHCDTKDFASGLRAALRQDPDVILVGEMRDLETISTAITAAETGHLVLATLHTADAPQTIDRIIDVFPGHQQPQVRTQLAAVLVGIISQRLFPKEAGGRIVATEILVNTSAVANLIRSEKVHQIKSLLQTGRDQGMHTMEMAIRELIARNLITREAAQDYLDERALE
jgi:twitching motility protein PilT